MMLQKFNKIIKLHVGTPSCKITSTELYQQQINLYYVINNFSMIICFNKQHTIETVM